MVKIVGLIRRRTDLSFDEFLHYWCDEHPAYVRALPGLRRYVQNPARPHRTSWPWDGLAELWFDDVYAVKMAFESPAAGPLREHEELFLEEVEWFLADERVVLEQFPATEKPNVVTDR